MLPRGRGQGDLPLSIVYTGVGGTQATLAADTDKTVLFYGWEPVRTVQRRPTFWFSITHLVAHSLGQFAWQRSVIGPKGVAEDFIDQRTIR